MQHVFIESTFLLCLVHDEPYGMSPLSPVSLQGLVVKYSDALTSILLSNTALPLCNDEEMERVEKRKRQADSNTLIVKRGVKNNP